MRRPKKVKLLLALMGVTVIGVAAVVAVRVRYFPAKGPLLPKTPESALKDLARRRVFGGGESEYWKRMRHLLSLGPPAHDALAKAAESNLAGIRMVAIEALALMGSPLALEKAVKALEDKDEDVRHQAIRVLGFIGDSKALAALVEVLRDENETGQYTVGMADPLLGEFARGYYRKHVSLRAAAAEELGLIGRPEAVGPLIDSLHDEDPEVLRKSAKALEWMKDNEDMQTRVSEIERSGPWVTSSSFFGLVLDRLYDEDPELFRKAMVALGRIGNEEAIQELLLQLDSGVAWREPLAASGLGYSRREDVVPRLIQAMQDGNLQAPLALARIGGKASFDAIVQALKHDDRRVAVSAVYALAMMEDPAAVEPLREVVESEGGRLAAVAADAIRRYEFGVTGWEPQWFGHDIRTYAAYGNGTD